MRCPSLKDLPPPPPGKTGWPWTEESSQIPDTRPNGRPWPKVSIITPNYNYGRFIEETIRSVLLQGYPNLEYIIIDGGSTDNSLEIIEKYEPWLAHWTSKPDKGVYEAINKGIKISTGDIIGIVNSDDLYGLNTLKLVAEKFIQSNADTTTGGVIIFRDTNQRKCKITAQHTKSHQIKLSLPNVTSGCPILNARFFRKYIYKKFGLYNTDYTIASDREFLIRLALNSIKDEVLEEVIYYYRQHSKSLTIDPNNINNIIKFINEHLDIAEKYLDNKEIDTSSKHIIRKWHSREVAKCVLYSLGTFNIPKAAEYSSRGWKYNKYWPMLFITNSLSIIIDQLNRKLSF